MAAGSDPDYVVDLERQLTRDQYLKVIEEISRLKVQFINRKFSHYI